MARRVEFGVAPSRQFFLRLKREEPVSSRGWQQFRTDGVNVCLSDLRQLFCIADKECHIAETINSARIPGRDFKQSH